jgi:RimJ/RimL family protein N-acetyltransferase
MGTVLSFRPAAAADVRQVFEWSNDPQVRAQSFNNEPIAWAEHDKWYAKKLNSHSDMLLIALANDQPAGFVRFENINQKATIGILVGAEWRGKGLAASIIALATNTFFATHKVPVHAYIKKQNVASIKAFQRAGYAYVADSDICGAPSVEYIKYP